MSKLKPISAIDTGKAKMPSLVFAPTGNDATDRALDTIREHLEVSMGARGNPWEERVTRRDLKSLQDAFSKMEEQKKVGFDGNNLIFDLGNGSVASLAIDQFIKSIQDLPLFKDLMRRLDDPDRFKNLPGEIRRIVEQSVADEAAKLGTQISRAESISTSANRALAMQVDRLTAAVRNAQAGIRKTEFVTAENNFAQAGRIIQLEASLGNYYQDGKPGRAILEEQMTVTADRINGLSSQWTIKVQAGGAIAGIGLAATEDGAGNTTSAFIVRADKFAVVTSDYTSGLTNTPNSAYVPFGVDAYGIYMNNNVYVRGTMRVDTGGKTLIDGLRGSLALASSSYWSDASARNLVYQQLGKGSSAPNNNHLVIGDTVTMGTGQTAVTRTWNGTAWVNPGVMINGNLIVSGSISAPAINTNGLVIRDYAGNPILGAGNQLPVSYITGLGAMATESAATIGSTVKFPNGVVMQTTDFVNRLARINSGNIGTFMDTAAIGTAYIGTAAVGTLQIAGNSVTVPVGRTAGNVTIVGGNGTPGYTALIFDEYIDLGVQSTNSALLGICSFFMRSTDDAMGLVAYYINGAGPYGTMEFGLRVAGGGDTDMNMPISLSFIRTGLSGNVRVSVRVTSIPNSVGGYHNFEVRSPTLMLFGGKR